MASKEDIEEKSRMGLDYLHKTHQRRGKRRGIRCITIKGRKFEIFDDVFSPESYPGTIKYAEEALGFIKPGSEVAEMGCGVGVFAVLAAYEKRAFVSAYDLNPKAVANTRRNLDLNGLADRVREVRVSDVYSGVRSDARFDTIFWNAPYFDTRSKQIPLLDRSILDPGHDSKKRFILEARDHLSPNGQLLLGYSSTEGDMEVIERFIEEARMGMEIVTPESQRVFIRAGHKMSFELTRLIAFGILTTDTD